MGWIGSKVNDGIIPARAGSTLADLGKHTRLAGFSITFLSRASLFRVGVDNGSECQWVRLE